MRTLLRSAAWTFAVASVALVAAQGLAGQQLASYPEIDAMDAEAMALAYASTPGSLEKAAWRHGHVAFLRQEDDAHRFHCLRTQAQLLKAIGYVDGARVYLEEAARQAEAEGDVYNAAMTLIDAAILANDAGDSWDALDLGTRARELTASARLDVLERATILRRLG